MKRGRIRTFFYRVARILLLAYGGLVLTLAGCQHRYIYYPGQAGTEQMETLAEQVGAVAWRNGDEERIGWRFPAGAGSSSGLAAIVFHGNAGTAIDRMYYAEGLQQRAGGEKWTVYVLEYPGYGGRPGEPGEDAFFEAAREGIRTVLETREGSVFLIGESLGSGVASQMAAEFGDRIGGLLLITPFTSLTDVASRHFPWVPVRLLLRDRYDNVSALRDYPGPLAVVLAEKDEIVPADFGKELFDGYEGRKKLWIQEDRTHNTIDFSPEAEWWQEVEAFFLDFQQNASP